MSDARNRAGREFESHAAHFLAALHRAFVIVTVVICRTSQAARMRSRRVACSVSCGAPALPHLPTLFGVRSFV